MEKNDQARLKEIVHRQLAESVSQHLRADGFLITVVDVELSPDGNRVKAYVSVLPDKLYGTALEALRKLSPVLRSELVKKTRLRVAPKINWRIDSTEREAAKLEEVFKEIEE